MGVKNHKGELCIPLPISLWETNRSNMMSESEQFEWDSKNYTHDREVHYANEFPLLTYLIHNHNLTIISHISEQLNFWL
jgi:hypothetical protein